MVFEGKRMVALAHLRRSKLPWWPQAPLLMGGCEKQIEPVSGALKARKTGG